MPGFQANSFIIYIIQSYTYTYSATTMAVKSFDGKKQNRTLKLLLGSNVDQNLIV